MGMYNMLFGSNPASSTILATLGLTVEDIGRFRDCFVTDNQIAIYTRLGGGNKECFCESKNNSHEGFCYVTNIETMRAHPNFLYDQDDTFDETYCTYYFSFPDQFKDKLSK